MHHSPIPLPRPETSSLLVVDVQERLLPAMAAEAQAPALRNIALLLELYEVFGGQVVVTEQYPKGLGPTVPAIAEKLPAGATRFEKVAFSALREPGSEGLGLQRDVILTGMETHVCVLQTALDLLQAGHRVFVAEDAVLSRAPANRLSGIALMARAGALPLPTESLVFAALERAGTDTFKRFSRLLR